MNIQSVLSQNNLNFEGKVYPINLSKKQSKIVHQLRPFLNKQVENKNYNLYISSSESWSWKNDGLVIWAGKSSKYPNKKMVITNDYFTNETVTSSTRQAVAKYEGMFGSQNLARKKSLLERIFG